MSDFIITLHIMLYVIWIKAFAHNKFET